MESLILSLYILKTITLITVTIIVFIKLFKNNNIHYNLLLISFVVLLIASLVSAHVTANKIKESFKIEQNN